MVGKIVNAPKLTINGIELEFAWRAADRHAGYRTESSSGTRRRAQPPIWPGKPCISRSGLPQPARPGAWPPPAGPQPQSRMPTPATAAGASRTASTHPMTSACRTTRWSVRASNSRPAMRAVRPTCATCSTPAPETLKHPPRRGPVFRTITVAEPAGSCPRTPAVPFDQPAAARSISSNCVTVRTRDMRGKMRVMNCSWLSASGEVQASLAMTRS